MALTPDGPYESIYITGPEIGVLNNSDEPVYRVVIYQVLIQGAGPHDGETHEGVGERAADYRVILGVLPPGRWTVAVAGTPTVPQGRWGAKVGFTDRAGAHWIRRANGVLEEIPTGAVEYYGIPSPIDFSTPNPNGSRPN